MEGKSRQMGTKLDERGGYRRKGRRGKRRGDKVKDRVGRWGEGKSWMREEDTGGKGGGADGEGQDGRTEWAGGERVGVG